MHIVHTESSCGWGGQEIRILTEAKGLQDRGHQVTLIVPEISRIYKEAIKYEITTVALPIERKSLKALLSLRNWIKNNQKNIDVVNTHSSTDSWLMALVNQTVVNKLPLIRTRHVSSPINTKKSTQWLYQKAVKHIVVTGEPLRQRMFEVNRFSLETLTSIPTGIDLQRFYPRNKRECREQLNIDQNIFIVGILATLRSWKGHEYLIKAIKLLNNKKIKLYVVGDGPYRAKLEQLVTDLKLSEKVIFVGNQNNPEIWLNIMDIFVLPSYGDEGVSQAVMQAMASRLPVITTAVGGMTDAVCNNKTGLIVETKNEESIKEAITSLIKNQDQKKCLSESAYQEAVKRFGMEIMLDNMEKIFKMYLKSSEQIL